MDFREFGYIKVGCASPKVKVADTQYNTAQIIELMKKAESESTEITVFPELCITGYTCADLFFQEQLLKETKLSISKIMQESENLEGIFLIGAPLMHLNRLYNTAIVISKGSALGVVPKACIPNYNEFYEVRWFASGYDLKSDTINILGKDVPFGLDLVFKISERENATFSIEICEDMWTPISPGNIHAVNGANIIFNLSASNELVGKCDYRKQLVTSQSGRNISGYVYASSGIGESSTDLVFGGHCLIAEYGSIINGNNRFELENNFITGEIDLQRLASERIKSTSFMQNIINNKARIIPINNTILKLNDIKRDYAKHPFVPGNIHERDIRCNEIFSIQTSALMKRLEHIGFPKVIIGISGGLDSTLALLVTVRAFDRLHLDKKNIIAITMPGFGTTDHTYHNAVSLIKSVGATFMQIDIQEACKVHFKDIGHDMKEYDVTYENVQARERTQLLMDIANKERGIVIGTGDLSEMALGWCTYNGDHMSMYAVNCSVPKTLVKYLVKWVCDNEVNEDSKKILYSIIDTPISPELVPPDKEGKIKQKTEDIIGPYELHDFFLYHIVRYGASPKKVLKLAEKTYEDKYSQEIIKKYLKEFYRRFFMQQFKRSCIPDGPKVGTISLSPRGDWRMPSDASSSDWMKELE